MIGIAGAPAGGGGGPQTPGQASLTLDCPAGDLQIIGEAIYGESAGQPTLTPRVALRRFARRHFPGLLRLRFVTVARRGERQQLVATRNGSRVASVLLARGSAGARVEGATACESVAGGG